MSGAKLLNTGSWTQPTVATNGSVVNTTPDARVVFPTEHEQYIKIPPNTMVVLTAYTHTKEPINLYKILLSQGNPDTAEGNGCCLEVVKGGDITILNRVPLPQYVMDKSNPVRVITVPGNYLVQPTKDADGTLQITAESFPLQQAGPYVNTFPAPSADTPSADTPSADTPSADTPSADTPSADTPSIPLPNSSADGYGRAEDPLVLTIDRG